MGLFSKNKTSHVEQETVSKSAELVIEKDTIQKINQIRNAFSEILNLFPTYEKVTFIKDNESIIELKSRLNSLETNTLNLRGKMNELQEVAEKLEASLLKSRKSDLENRERHLATHEKEVLDYVYQIDKIIDRLVEQIRMLGLLDFKKTILVEKMPRDTEPHKQLAKQLIVMRRSVDDLSQRIKQLYDFETENN